MGSGARIAAIMADSGPITALVFTWNVGNAEPKEADLAEWLPHNPTVDVIAVGTQVRIEEPSVKTL